MKLYCRLLCLISMADAQNWGKAQATAAIAACRNNTFLINTSTIFADVELGFGGWFTTGTDINWGVFVGFIDGIRAGGKIAGVYTSRGAWQDIMGISNSPAYASVVWGANWPSGSTFDNPPSSMDGCYSINGATPTIWQYYAETGAHDPSVTGDANIASSLPA